MKIDIKIDVSHATPFAEPQHVMASVFLPGIVRQPATLLVCLPGGGYARGYYDAAFPGMPGYSMAAWFTSRGYIVCTLDNLGTGESSRPRDESRMSVTVAAAANQAATTQIAAMIEGGKLPGYANPIALKRKIGVGHSMGGMFLIAQQGAYATFDRVAPVGWTNYPLDLGEEFIPPAVPDDAPPADRYVLLERGSLQRRLFYWDDVPASLIDIDVTRGTVVPITVIREIMTPGTVMSQAKAIRVPVFLAFGERDNCPEPRREPTAFPSSPDITLYILPRSAHCHNFASTRELLWQRLLNWMQSD